MDYHAQFRLANDPEASQETLERLSRSSFELIRGAVASNPNTGEKTLLYLALDSSSHVIENLMANSKYGDIRSV